MSDQQILSDAAKSEIAAAVAIVASDKSYTNLQKIRDHLIPPTPENSDPPNDGDPTPPPKKDEPSEPPDDDETQGGLFWHKDRFKE